MTPSRCFGWSQLSGGRVSEPRRGQRQCVRCSRNRAERFFTPRGKTCSACRKQSRSRATHDRRVQVTYGLGPGEYEVLFAAQGGVCAICGQTRRTRLDVDHDHATGLVRGLCCRLCNRKLLTAARNSPAVLRNAAGYLEAPPALRFLGPRYHIENREE
ncbi:endonuclease VII domain-containing protein [Streptomyces sp. CBMA29]|uniref:endonuclease VII domain-containing protein n=1 Tax=Streptomyces sp. CBMA29 TaxID=1896314 RepID=UPI0016619E37|nr:endonuclease VII domain-containing protein [Streptomyces sp. CBMA29]